MAFAPTVVAVKGVDTLYRVNGGSATTFTTALTTLRTFHGLGRTEARALLFDAAQRAAAPNPKPAPVINHPDWSKPWTNPT